MRREIPAETIVHCDRCDTDMTRAAESMNLRVFSVALAMQSTVDAGPGPYSGRTLDLCAQCMRDFVTFIESGR